jgi:hypothetical protein
MTPPVDAAEMQSKIPSKTITPEEGVVLAEKAFNRGLTQPFRTILLDTITDPIQPRSYKPDANPDDPGRRRLHPLLVSTLIFFGLLFAMFVYFTYWQH